MNLEFGFLAQNALIGIGLAMDAFSVSVANGLNEPCMKKRKMFGIAGMFAIFQALMPMIGWICVHTVIQYFEKFKLFIPCISLGLLGYIGGKMIYECLADKDCDCCEKPGLGITALLIQGIATSIDALSVGLTIAEYNLASAIIAALIIALITFVICFIGVLLGKTAGTKLSGKAEMFGGIILIAIGIEIFLSGTGIINF